MSNPVAEVFEMFRERVLGAGAISNGTLLLSFRSVAAARRTNPQSVVAFRGSDATGAALPRVPKSAAHDSVQKTLRGLVLTEDCIPNVCPTPQPKWWQVTLQSRA